MYCALTKRNLGVDIRKVWVKDMKPRSSETRYYSRKSRPFIDDFIPFINHKYPIPPALSLILSYDKSLCLFNLRGQAQRHSPPEKFLHLDTVLDRLTFHQACTYDSPTKRESDSSARAIKRIHKKSPGRIDSGQVQWLLSSS